MLQEPVEAVASPQPDLNMADATEEVLNDIQSMLGMIVFFCLCIGRNTFVMLMARSQVFQLNSVYLVVAA